MGDDDFDADQEQQLSDQEKDEINKDEIQDELDKVDELLDN